MQIIDLSLPIDDRAYEVHKVKIERISHRAGIKKFNQLILGKTFLGKLKYLFGKRILKEKDLPDEEFLSLEIVHSPVHIGTHLDYTFHYGSFSEEKPAKTAEEIPLEWCYQDGVKLDFTYKKQAELITDKDVEEALKKIKYQLKPYDIVLFFTGRDKLYGKKEYFLDYPGVDISAIDFLLSKEIKIFGIDTMGIDRPYSFMLKEFLEKKDRSKFYPAHFYGRKKSFIHIERLANLDKLPSFGFKVICFPIKIYKTGASWARVVAILN